jgi:gamma-glutamylcyclotransferase (GGCT)/AIG2-like uncharacterized protein YtfP
MGNKLSNTLAVYGTLRIGHGNWSYFLQEVPLLKEKDIVTGFKMVTFGGFPAIIHTGNEEDTVVVDVFDMSQHEDISRSILSMETGAGYDITDVTTESGLEAHVYTYTEAQASSFMDIDIHSGDWTKWVAQGDHY